MFVLEIGYDYDPDRQELDHHELDHIVSVSKQNRQPRNLGYVQRFSPKEIRQGKPLSYPHTSDSQTGVRLSG